MSVNFVTGILLSKAPIDSTSSISCSISLSELCAFVAPLLLSTDNKVFK